MKKDKKWLKEAIGDLDYTKAMFVYDGVSYIDTAVSVMQVYDLIDQLDEPEVLSLEWIYEYATEVTHDEILDQTEIVYVDELENLLVPKQEITEEQVMDWLNKNDFYDHITAETVLERAVDKGELSYYGTKYSVIETPTIPKHVADWIEEVKGRKLTLYGAICDCPREVGYWLRDGDCSNQETFARAWIDGFTVEKEQKYYARIKGWELFADFVDVQYWGIVPIYGRLGFVSADDAKDKTKDEWKRLGIDDSNAEFVEVV